ncbi:MAG: hypothetical protein ABR582_02615 [Gemmatimonadaceae bacterium]
MAAPSYSRCFTFASVAATVIAFALSPSLGGAQGTQVQLTVTGGPLTFGAPTAADLTVGKLESTTALTYQAETSAEPTGGTHTTTVYIRSSVSTLGGGKAVADLEWRRADDATWHALTTSDVAVQSRTDSFSLQGHTWSNSIYFRVALHWTGDPPATYTGNLVLTVSATQP